MVEKEKWEEIGSCTDLTCRTGNGRWNAEHDPGCKKVISVFTESGSMKVLLFRDCDEREVFGDAGDRIFGTK